MTFQMMNILQGTYWTLVSPDGQQIIGGEDRNKHLMPVESDERIMFYKSRTSALQASKNQYPHHDLRPAKVVVTIEEIVQNELEE